MMKPEKFNDDFLVARAKTVTAISSASGWTQGMLNQQVVGVDSVFFYVLDASRDWVWCCSVPRGSFEDALARYASAGLDAAASWCGQQIESCAAKTSFTENDELDLAASLCAYFPKTQTFQLSERATTANHLVVIRYSATGMLRPFALKGPQRYLLPYESVHGAMRSVVAKDAASHPQWVR